MKVTLKFEQQAYHGKMNDLVYYWHPRAQRMIARRKPLKQKTTAQNERMGQIAMRLREIVPSPGYAEDLRIYLRLCEAEDHPLRIMSWYALYTKIMWEMQRAQPETVDLATITRAQIGTDNLPCRCLKDAIEAGLLPPVKGYERFTEII